MLIVVYKSVIKIIRNNNNKNKLLFRLYIIQLILIVFIIIQFLYIK